MNIYKTMSTKINAKKTKNRYIKLGISIFPVLFFLFLFLSCVFQLPKIEYNKDTLEYKLEEIRYKYNLPSLCASITENDNQPVFAATGYRSSCNISNKVTINDKWHIGSNTKSMTATLIAKLIEENAILDWNTSIIDVFPEFDSLIQPEYKDITFIELLSHTSGVIGDITKVSGWSDYFTDTSPIIEQRYKLVKEILKIKPEVPKGTFLYSNAGYIVAAAMLEKKLGKSWEELIQTYIFQPIGMNNTGFGAPKPQNLQPSGHTQNGSLLSFKPVDPDSVYSDNPKVLGPAGTIHITMQDIVKFAKIHLDGLKGSSTFLSQDSFTKLHQVVANSYALGWCVSTNTLFHYGSNTMWFAFIYIYYDSYSNSSKIIFICFNACFSDFNFNCTLMDEVFNSIANY